MHHKHKGLRRIVQVGPLHYVITATILGGYKDRDFGYHICVEPFLDRQSDGVEATFMSHLNYSSEVGAHSDAGDMLDFVEGIYNDLVDRNLGL